MHPSRSSRTALPLLLLLVLLAAALLAGCGGEEDAASKGGAPKAVAKDDDSKARTTEGIVAAPDEAAPAKPVAAHLRFTMTKVGSKGGGASAGLPRNLACTRSIPATCRGELTCPVEDGALAWQQGACEYLARRVHELLPSDVHKGEPHICTEQYGGPETMQVEGPIGDAYAPDGGMGLTLTRTDGCAIAQWDLWAPVWGEAAPDTPDCVTPPAASPEAPVSSEDPLPCRAPLDDGTVAPGDVAAGVTTLPPVKGGTPSRGGGIQPETHEDPPGAFR